MYGTPCAMLVASGFMLSDNSTQGISGVTWSIYQNGQGRKKNLFSVETKNPGFPCAMVPESL